MNIIYSNIISEATGNVKEKKEKSCFLVLLWLGIEAHVSIETLACVAIWSKKRRSKCENGYKTDVWNSVKVSIRGLKGKSEEFSTIPRVCVFKYTVLA